MSQGLEGRIYLIQDIGAPFLQRRPKKVREVKRINFTPHAREKLKRLLRIGVTEEGVIKTIESPDRLISGYFGRKIAQSTLKADLVLRVVYEEIDNKVLVITIYPAERRRYE